MPTKQPEWVTDIEVGAAYKKVESTLICGECGHPMASRTFDYVSCNNPDCPQCNALVYPPK